MKNLILAIALLAGAGAHAQTQTAKPLLGKHLRLEPQAGAPSAECTVLGRVCFWYDGNTGLFMTRNADATDSAIVTGVPLRAGDSLTNGASWLWHSVGNDFFDIEPNDPSAVPWRMGLAENPNVSGSRKDNVMTFGWNVSATGVVDATKAHLGMNFEDHWINEFSDPQSEWYIVAGPPVSVGPGYRPIAINTSDTDPLLTKIMVHAHDIQLGAGVGPSAGQTQVALSDGAVDLYSPDTLKHLTLSNTQFRLIGPNIGGAGSKTIYLFDGDPTWQPGTAMRSEGHILPASSTASLGLYADNLAGRNLWANVAAKFGQFITTALGPADYNHVGQLALLYSVAENTFANLYVQAADGAGVPRWERVATDTSGINPAGTEGTLHVGAQLNGASADVNQYQLYTPNEGGAAQWSQAIYQATNAGSARKNQVHAFGWNVGANGGQLVGGEAAVGMSFESFYQPAGTAVSELHIIKYTNAGTLLRPFSMEFNRSTGRDTLALSSDAIYVEAPGQGTTWWMFNTADAGELFCYTLGSAIYWDTNNQTFLQQRNAANNGYIPVVGTNASDQVVVGSASYGVLLAAGWQAKPNGDLQGVVAGHGVQPAKGAFASLAGCAAGTEGMMVPVTDSTTATWGATITGGGANHVLAYCDGTNWTVAAK